MSDAGVDAEGTSDPCHVAWHTLVGDFIVRARVEFVGQGFDPHRRFGWRVRASSDSAAPHVDACVHGDGLMSLQYRATQGGEADAVKLPLHGGDVVQLERRGNVYVFSSACAGETFRSAQVEIELGGELQVGLLLCSRNVAVKDEAIFRDVRIIRPAPVGFQPYRDYIGSQLEVLNVHTGKLEVLHQSAEPYEAPNWMPDGETLMLNVSGSGANKGVLRTFNLKSGQWAPLDTGFAVKNNNDHVLSFDGKHLGISHHSADDGGQSVIYTLPATGGAPRRVTPKSPSYLHGWSPDGQWLTYTGGRDGKYDIYKIPAGGGEEIRLTDTPGLSDGPEYSPDGRSIYYNSTRSGLMQLWRMKPDGSAQEQLTNDEFNNWFPHLSPDGKWIAFLSYGQDVKPEDHPYYRHAYLRLMPADGGTPRVIAYVYGGQGTINVPSWSPDSTRIAFVTNNGAIQ